jgi:hypothetical protein
LVQAARKVVRRWAKGDLAEAVRELDQILKGMKNAKTTSQIQPQ